MPVYAGPGRVTIEQLIRTELEEIAWNYQQVGQAVSQYDILYRDGSFWYGASAHQPSTAPQTGIGMAQDAAVSGARSDVWLRGIISNGAWSLVSGAVVFLASGGGVTMSSPTPSGSISMVLGRAFTTTVIEFNPQTPIQIGG